MANLFNRNEARAFVKPFKDHKTSEASARNPFGNDSLVDEEKAEDPELYMKQIEAFNNQEITADAVRDIQALIIKYFMVTKVLISTVYITLPLLRTAQP